MMLFLFKQVVIVEDILNGGEGDKFKVIVDIIFYVQKLIDNDGKINSIVCLIQ